MRIDLQVHTALGSSDSSITPEQFAKACVKAGLDGAGVTEHEPCDYGPLSEAFSSEGLVLLAGREVSCRGAHVLVFSSDYGFLAQLSRICEPNDLRLDQTACIWAHPAAPSGSSAYPPGLRASPDLADVVHCVEVLNGRHLMFEDAVLAVEGLGLPSTGGSDAHEYAAVGRCATFVEGARDQSQALSAIRAGHVRPVLSKAWALEHDYSYRPSLAKYLG